MIKKTIILVPSHNRAKNAEDLHKNFLKHAPINCNILFIIEESDLDEYANLIPDACLGIAKSGSRGMVRPLNEFAYPLASKYETIIFMGDDHRLKFNTIREIDKAFDIYDMPMVYCNDLIHGENLPTAISIKSDLILTLGFMALPTLWHLYVDNFWKELGKQIGIKYLPNIYLEHLHPTAGTAQDDINYQAVNSPSFYKHDRDEFDKWCAADGPHYLGLKYKAKRENDSHSNR